MHVNLCCVFFLWDDIARQTWGLRSPDWGEPASRSRLVGQEALRPPITLERPDTLYFLTWFLINVNWFGI